MQLSAIDFAEKVVGMQLAPWQREVLRSLSRTRTHLYMGGRPAGKRTMQQIVQLAIPTRNGSGNRNC